MSPRKRTISEFGTYFIFCSTIIILFGAVVKITISCSFLLKSYFHSLQSGAKKTDSKSQAVPGENFSLLAEYKMFSTQI